MSAARPSRVYVAVGTNLGDRQQNIAAAVSRLQRLAVGPVTCSAWYETAPIDMADDAGDFLNGAVTFMTAIDPRALLAALKEIEIELGRPADHGNLASGHHDSRIIDLDLIDYADYCGQDSQLTLPHPRAHLRTFVLQPLVDLEPGLKLAGQTRSVSALMAERRRVTGEKTPGR